jgi:integrase/recombinase XerD
MGNSDATLHSRHGQGRKYLNRSERRRFLAAATQLDDVKRLFVETLAWTGARISEVIALTPASFDLDLGYVTIVTLKRRKYTTRDIPLPPALLRSLDRYFALRHAQRDPHRAQRRLWTICRVTGWRIVKGLMNAIGLVGARATPRGLRHGFGVGAAQARVPITLLKRWMGHAKLSTTEIYLDVVGPEEIAFARQFWEAKTVVGAVDCADSSRLIAAG